MRVAVGVVLAALCLAVWHCWVVVRWLAEAVGLLTFMQARLLQAVLFYSFANTVHYAPHSARARHTL